MLRKDCKRSRFPRSKVRIKLFFLRAAPLKCPLFAVDTFTKIKSIGKSFGWSSWSHLLKKRVDHLVKPFPLLHHIIWMLCLQQKSSQVSTGRSFLINISYYNACNKQCRRRSTKNVIMFVWQQCYMKILNAAHCSSNQTKTKTYIEHSHDHLQQCFTFPFSSTSASASCQTISKAATTNTLANLARLLRKSGENNFT